MDDKLTDTPSEGNVALSHLRDLLFGDYLSREGLTEIAINRPGELHTKINGAWEMHASPVTLRQSTGSRRSVLLASQAKAAASTAWGSMPNWLVDVTATSGSAAARPCIRCVLRTPPPHTSNRCTAGAWRRRCSVAACTVKAVSVACTSAGGNAVCACN